jgi:hypothetical protein
MIGQANDVSRICFIQNIASLRQEGQRIVGAHLFVIPTDLELHTTLKMTRANA